MCEVDSWKQQLVKDLRGLGRRVRGCSQRGAAGTAQLACDPPSFGTESRSVTATWGKWTTQGGQAKPRH